MTDHTFTQLIPIYSSPDRAYHNLAHIQACLSEFEAVRSLASNPTAMQTAIWFHDVIYDTHAHDNEERSADFAIILPAIVQKSATTRAARQQRYFFAEPV